ncbi:MAG: hypothetical protein RMJ03_04700 [Nitrososphaerota archaeon]|nr:hypothetical protein [Nitrososphaerota archaeon]MDW8040705.1 hypothetical protein [Nitrososphaerota archaeon]
MEKTAVVDVDETLFISGFVSQLLRKAAAKLFKLSLAFQKPNKQLIEKLKEYDVVIVLTARGENYRSFTERQLKHHGVKFNQLVMCQYNKLIYLWKKGIIETIKPCEWFDDIKQLKEYGLEGYR